MKHEFILGTAGHIDHGKTSLVLALTGIDCDRLPEEKARGMTIDLGFAHLDLGEFHLGIVDVPGHERFIRNMLAGATGIDLCLLVVAADDSVMPQTREHLEILSLLGIEQGVIALNKADLVDEATLEIAEWEIRELVAGTFLEGAAMVRTSARQAWGIEELRSALAEACRRVTRADQEDWFRLAIDRSFAVQGHGTVVTGSVASGRLRAGEEVEWLPRGVRLRVRELQNHGQPVDEVRRGMRAAAKLAGVKHTEIGRGHELATPGYLAASQLLTVRLRASADNPRGIKHRAAVRVHLGSAEVMGTVSVLEAPLLKPGDWGLAQLALDAPVAAVWGQPLVLRNSSAEATLGGGTVLVPVARKIRRKPPELLARLRCLAEGSLDERAAAAGWLADFQGLDPVTLGRAVKAAPHQVQPLVDRLLAASILLPLRTGPSREVLLHADRVGELENHVLAALARLHREHPFFVSHDRQHVEGLAGQGGQQALAHAATSRLIAAGRIHGDAHRVRLAGFQPRLTAAQAELKERILAAYSDARFHPPRPSELAPLAGGNARLVDEMLQACLVEGLLVPIQPDVYLHAAVEAELRRIVSSYLEQRQRATVAELRDLLQTNRRLVLPLCEHLDRVGLTRREGDYRTLARR